jgi:biofilm PGA synthesis N-glycosyltransferase PgaC
MPQPSRRYLLITPCRNEVEFGRQTLDSVVAQSVQPAKWIIVDDGSTDGTSEMLAEYAAEHAFIEVIRKPDRGKRSVGPGVIESFYLGYDASTPRDFDYLCKLDLDLELPPEYFQTLMERMEANPRIGTCSGKPYVREPDGSLHPETSGDEMSVGMTKFYRVDCFEQIGGFVREVMWDGIDCHRCRMLGWIACSWDVPELRFIHLRPMGSSQQNILVGRLRHGYGQYFMGTGVAYMAASAAFRMAKPPLVVGGLCMFAGYLSSLLRGRPRYGDAEFRRFLRSYQLDCLRLGKAKATEKLNERMADKWHAAVSV